MPVVKTQVKFNSGDWEFRNITGDAIARMRSGTGERELDIPSGATIDINGTFQIAGVTVTVSAAQLNALGGVTLDGAYDQGGAGAGRTINAHDGAVVIQSTDADNNNVLEITKNPVGAQSGAGISVTMGAQATGAGVSFANTGSGNDLLGSGSTWSVSKAGVGTFDSLSVGQVTLTEDVLPAVTSAYIGRDNTGDVTINALNTKQVHVAINGVDVLDVAGAGVTVTGTLTVSSTITVTGGMTFASQIIANAGLDLNGTELIVDADGDSSLTADTDDRLDVKLGNADEYAFGTLSVDLNSNHLDNAGYLILNAVVLPAVTEVYVGNDNAGDLTLNALNAKTVNIAIAGTDFIQISATALAFQAAAIISTAATTLTLTPTTDVVVSNGTGLIIGAAVQETISNGDGATDLVPEFQIQGTAQADGSMLLVVFNTTNDQTVAPMVALVKSGNAAIGTHTIVADNEVVGRLVAFGDDGVDLETPVAEIRFVVDDAGAPGADAIGGSIEFYSTADGGSTLTLGFTLAADQNIYVANNNGLVLGHTAFLTTAGATQEMQVLGTAGADSSLLLGYFANDTGYPGLVLMHSRSGTIGTSAILQDGDTMGGIVFVAADGNDFATIGARITARVDAGGGVVAQDDMPSSLVFETTSDGAASPTERMRLDQTGRLRLGAETINDANMVIGIVIGQGSNDNHILAFDSTDVITGLTTAVASAVNVDTNKFAVFEKLTAAEGGLRITSLSENAATTVGLLLEQYGGQASATKSTAGRALIEVYASQHDGANALANIAADGNVFAVRGRVGAADVTLAIVDEDGDLWLGGSVTAATIIGSTAAGGDLGLISTSDATKGTVYVPDGTLGLHLGAAADGWAAGQNYLYFKNSAAAPAGAPATAGAGLYAAAGELYAIDNAGNTSLQSPHDSDGYEIIKHSAPKRGNKVLVIEVEKLLEALADKDPSLKKFFHEFAGKAAHEVVF